MKALLNITIFISSILSIVLSSVNVYEMPVIKETLSVVNLVRDVSKSDGDEDTVRVYISHDSSEKDKERSTTLIVAGKKDDTSTSPKNYIEAFGVKVPVKNEQGRI